MNGGMEPSDPYHIPKGPTPLVDRLNDGGVVIGMAGVGAIVLAFIFAVLVRST